MKRKTIKIGFFSDSNPDPVCIELFESSYKLLLEIAKAEGKDVGSALIDVVMKYDLEGEDPLR